jgi:hypothetical protein
LSGREKQFVITKLDEMRDSVTTEMKDECGGLKDYVKDITDKAAAKSATLQQKYNDKLDGIKDVCA